MPDWSIDAICDEFEEAWRNGEFPGLTNYLDRVPASDRWTLIAEIIPIDIEWRQNRGTSVTASDYAEFHQDAVELAAKILSGHAAQNSQRGSPAESPIQAESPVRLATEESFLAETQTRDSETPDQVGQYKIMQVIGVGGMGTVYMAQQSKPIRRRVALKLIKPGLDSTNVIRRFEAERQALALMDHDNIAKVLDAGKSSDGRPYFVMELVNGIPITQYCDDYQLPLNERLQLFIQTCKAIQHAHQKGIIHRDIKPSNVLVTHRDGDPMVKVIDFGLAKALDNRQHLTDETMFTAFGQVLGTLQYMSPEQAELSSQDVDTRSDVYSLGVLLYELLTGSTPLEKSTLKELAWDRILATIRENDSPFPSQRLSSLGEAGTTVSQLRGTDAKRLTQVLKGDLDWITMKALDKDRSRRYETPLSFADDVLRYLACDPVEARAPSNWYRLRKLVRKHQFATFGTITIALILIATTTLTSIFAIRAARAEKDARQKAREQVLATHKEIAERNKATELSIENQILAKKEAKLREEAEKIAADLRQSVESERAARKRAELNDYRNKLNASLLAWQRDNAADAWRNLNATQQEYRGLEYGYLEQLYSQGQLNLAGNTHPIKSIALSPDGRLVVGCGGLGTAAGEVVIWNSHTGDVLHKLNSHAMLVNDLEFSTTGDLLITVSDDQTCRVWETREWNLVKTIDLEHPVSAVQLSADGQHFVISAGLTISQISIDSFDVERLFKAHHHDVSGLALGKDGSVVTMVRNSHRELDDLFGPGSEKVKHWRFENGKHILRNTKLSVPASHEALIISDDGLLLTARSGSATLRSVDLNNSQSSIVHDEHSVPITCIAISRDNRYIASASEDKTILVWDSAKRAVVHQLKGHTDQILAIRFHHDGSKIVSTTGGETIIWSLDKLKSTNIDANSVQNVHTNLDGSIVVAWRYNSTHAKLWDAATGQLLQRIGISGDALEGCSLAENGERIATRHRSGKVLVWDLATGAVCTEITLTDRRHDQVEISADGRLLASKSSDDYLAVYDADSGKRLHELKLYSSRFDAFAFSRDGKKLAAGGFRTNNKQDGETLIKIWDTESGKLIYEIGDHPGSPYPIVSISFNPNGDRLVSSSRAYDSTRIWDLVGQEEPIVVREKEVKEAIFDATGERILTASNDVKIWNADDATLLLTLQRHAREVNAIDISGDNRVFFTVGWDSQIAIWETARKSNSSETSLISAEEAFQQVMNSVHRRIAPLSPKLLKFLERRCVGRPNASCREVLGAAYFRVGKFDPAIAVLKRSNLSPDNESKESLRTTIQLAFLAMSHHRTSRFQSAKEFSSRLNQRMASKRDSRDPNAHRAWWEAQLVLSEQPTAPDSDSIQRLLKCGIIKGWSSAWGPDSESLLVSGGTFGPKPNGTLSAFRIRDGAVRELVAGGRDPAWSSSGRKNIAYVLDDKIYIRDALGANPRIISPGEFPSWSADGSTLFFREKEDKYIRAFRADDQNATPEDLMLCVSHHYPAVSPDGKRVAFYRRGQLVIAEIPTGKQLQTHSLAGWNGLLAGWSPDGGYVAFGDYGVRDEVGLWAMNTESGKVAKLLDGAYTMPRWSPDGKLISCDQRKLGIVELFRVEHLALPE